MSPIASMLTELRNAQMANLEFVNFPFSKMKSEIAKILKENGFIEDFEKKKKKAKKSETPILMLKLKYEDRIGEINGIKLISKPSRRMYVGKSELFSVRSDFGIAVISTSRGIMTNKEARKAGLGGELLFEIW